jgi:hypothetical protein
MKRKYYVCIGLLSAALFCRAQTIHRSACDGNLQRVDSLLQTQDVNVLDDKGRTPLLYATGCRRPKVFDLLLSKGADVNIGDQNGLYPILFAVQFGNEKFVDSLLAHNANVNVQGEDGNAPIHKSVLQGNVSITQKLLQAEAHVMQFNKRGNSPLEIAMREQYDTIANILISKGADASKVKTFQLEGDYFGQKEPGLIPTLFAPNVVSIENSVHTAMFHPDGKEFYFTKSLVKEGAEAIMVMKKINGKWTLPKRWIVLEDPYEFDAFITPDGSKLFFCSQKKVRDSDAQKNADMWVMNRKGNGWGKPIHLGNELNTSGNEWFPTVSKKGMLVFSINEGRKSTIYYSNWVNGKYQKPIAFDDKINSGGYDYDPLIAPDESFLIFASGRKGGFGANDLYISFKKEDGTWTQAKNMGDTINSKTTEYAPSLSPDGKYFFFTSNVEGSSDIYWVSSKVIENLKEEK